MQKGQHPLLQGVIHIDEEITAAHQIKARKGGIASEIVDGEDDHIPQLRVDPVTICIADEKAAETPLGNFGGNIILIHPFPADFNALGVDIGGEDLDGESLFQLLHRLEQEDGQGVRLFARGAPGNPDPHRPVGLPVRQHPDQFRLKGREGLGVAEKAGDVDQQIPEQRLGLLRVVPQIAGIIAQAIELMDGEPPLDAAADGVLLIAGKIVPRNAMNRHQHLLQVAIEALLLTLPPHLPAGGAGITDVADQFLPHLLHRQDQIDHPRLDGASRHAVELGLLDILRQHQPAGGIDGARPLGPVACGPGEDDSDGVLPLILSQGAEEFVDIEPHPAGRRWFLQVKPSLPKDQGAVRRLDEDGIRLRRHPVGNSANRHGAVSLQQRNEIALPLGIEVLHDDKSHTALGGQMIEEPLQSLQPPRGGADADHWEVQSAGQFRRQSGRCLIFSSGGGCGFLLPAYLSPVGHGSAPKNLNLLFYKILYLFGTRWKLGLQNAKDAEASDAILLKIMDILQFHVKGSEGTAGTTHRQ